MANQRPQLSEAAKLFHALEASTVGDLQLQCRQRLQASEVAELSDALEAAAVRDLKLQGGPGHWKAAGQMFGNL